MLMTERSAAGIYNSVVHFGTEKNTGLLGIVCFILFSVSVLDFCLTGMNGLSRQSPEALFSIYA